MILITTPTVYYIFSCSKIRVQMILYLLKEHEDDIIDFWIKDFLNCVFFQVWAEESVFKVFSYLWMVMRPGGITVVVINHEHWS